VIVRKGERRMAEGEVGQGVGPGREGRGTGRGETSATVERHGERRHGAIKF
jgi:hypothetical protein